jgi:anti-anti-sigma factor
LGDRIEAAVDLRGLLPMPNQELRVTRESRPGVSILHVAGSVDHAQSYMLEEAIQTLLDLKQTVLVVDLSELSYISSAGINALGHAVAQFQRVKGRLRLVRPAQTAQWHFFASIGVDQIFPWSATVEEAVSQVSSPAGA